MDERASLIVRERFTVGIVKEVDTVLRGTKRAFQGGPLANFESI